MKPKKTNIDEMPNLYDILYSSILVIIVFFLIYSVLFYCDTKNFKDATGYLDIFYFTTATQATVGSGEILPTTPISKSVASLQHIAILFIASQIVYTITSIIANKS